MGCGSRSFDSPCPATEPTDPGSGILGQPSPLPTPTRAADPARVFLARLLTLLASSGNEDSWVPCTRLCVKLWPASISRPIQFTYPNARVLAATMVLVRPLGGRRPGADDAARRSRLHLLVAATARRRACPVVDGVEHDRPRPVRLFGPALGLTLGDCGSLPALYAF